MTGRAEARREESMMNVLMFAHGGSLNRGCEAIVRSSAALIQTRIRGAKVMLASERPETDRGLNVSQVFDGSARTLKRFSPEWIVSSVRYKLLGDESYAFARIHRNVIRRIREADVCLSIGGDNYCYGEQPGWYEVDRRVKKLGRKLVLWCCSIGEEDLSERKLEDLRRFDLILARETLTHDVLRGRGLDNVRLVADPAFTLPGERLPLPPGWKEGDTIGVNMSPLVAGRNPAALEAVRGLIRHILETTDSAVALTPHVIEYGNSDLDTLRPLHEEFKATGRVLLLPGDLNAMQVKGYIARMRFFVGARTHATIAAYSSGVPTIVLGYSAKSKGIARDLFGRERLVIDTRVAANPGPALIDAFDEMIAGEQELRERLAGVIPRIQAMSRRSADYLADLA
jgi:polysaccharide pyruvyl transferase WcaK-like protein